MMGHPGSTGHIPCLERRAPERRWSSAIALAAAALVVLAAGCREPSVRVPVRFDVTVPADTPADARIVLHEEAPEAPELTELVRAADGHFRGEATGWSDRPLRFRVELVTSSFTVVELDDAWVPVGVRERSLGEAGGAVFFRVAYWDYPVDPARPPITFVVHPPATTPSGATLWLTGNRPELGAWEAAGVKLVRRSDGDLVTRLQLPAGAALAFKVTRGSWSTVERGFVGEDIPNRAFTVGQAAATVDMRVGTWTDQVQVRLTGEARYHRGISSAFLARNRDVIVYLPPDYASSSPRRYPVLYVHDGQNLMDPTTSFSGTEWGVDEAAQRLIRNEQMEPVIVVGVYNTADRIAEYTQVPNGGYGGGDADDYGRFLAEELKPLIDSTYRTLPEAEHTGLAGSSLGGLVSVYLGLTRPGTFNRIGAVSPSVWWGNRDILARVAALPAKLPLRVWVDIGTSEGPTPQEEVDNARALRDGLVAKGWTPGEDLAYLEVPGAEHDEAAWAARVDHVLRFLYPPR